MYSSSGAKLPQSQRPDAAFVPVSHFSGSVSVPLSHGNSDSVLSLAALPTYGAGFALAVFVIGSSSFASHRPAEFSISTAWCCTKVEDIGSVHRRLHSGRCTFFFSSFPKVRPYVAGSDFRFSMAIPRVRRAAAQRPTPAARLSMLRRTVQWTGAKIAAVARPDAAFVPVSHFSGSVSVPLSHGNSDSVLSLAALPTYGAGFALAVFVIGSSSMRQPSPSRIFDFYRVVILDGDSTCTTSRCSAPDSRRQIVHAAPNRAMDGFEIPVCGDGSQNITRALSGPVVKGTPWRMQGEEGIAIRAWARWRLPLSLFAGNLSMLIARDGFFCRVAGAKLPQSRDRCCICSGFLTSRAPFPFRCRMEIGFSLVLAALPTYGAG
ncbi:hypothetical protein U1Q18_051651 [Sarracenia purpurea var. burkii]